MTDKVFRQQREVVKFTQLELVSSVENKLTSPYTFIQTRTRFDKKGGGGGDFLCSESQINKRAGVT